MAKISFLYIAGVSLFTVACMANAEQPLKPGQQAAKDKMMADDSLKRQLEFTNKVCGTDLKVTADFSSYSMDKWQSGSQAAGYLEAVVLGVQGVCRTPAYKTALVKSLHTINVTFDGRGGADALPNFSMEHSTLTYRMNRENVNLSDKAADFIRRELDK